MTPLIFGAQRFAASSDYGIPPGEMQSGVAGSLGWASGEVNFLSPTDTTSSSSSARATAAARMLTSVVPAALNASSSDPDGAAAAAEERLPLPNEAVTLINLLITCSLAILMTLIITMAIVSAWRHLINRRYYKQQAAITAAKDAEDDDALAKAQACSISGVSQCAAVLSGKTKAQPEFFPWPKSLVWPAPLFFTCCIFVTGLHVHPSASYARATARHCSSVRTYSNAARCTILPITVLSVLVLSCSSLADLAANSSPQRQLEA